MVLTQKDDGQIKGRVDLQRLTSIAYPVAFLLAFVPLTELVAGIWPIRLGDVNWRFGSAGFAFNAMITPLLGLMLAMLAAGYNKHVTALKVMAVASVVVGAVLLAAAGVFLLDYIQLRNEVAGQAVASFDRAALRALVSAMLGSGGFFWLGRTGWKSIMKGRTPRGEPTAAVR